ncbi:hypothetical protein ACPV3A_29715 [Paenibacillus sp. Dod16]|uniref:hypothetical protein n=1 Tax=Paenibacillus sp. Dod16 TaxID=3416392 RepID=UPI003CF98502
MATEKWSIVEDEIKNFFPTDKIIEVIGRDPEIITLQNDEIRFKYPEQYNISVLARAYNDSMDSRLRKYYNTYHDDPKLKDLLKISLPQLMWIDTLGFNKPIISLHITKLNSKEIFINDIVIARNDNLDGLGNGVFDIVLKNLRAFARQKGIKIISGYAVNPIVFRIFETKGFAADKRTNMRNDRLWNASLQTEQQIPFYELL